LRNELKYFATIGAKVFIHLYILTM